MTQAQTSFRLAARWFVVLTTALLVLAGNVIAAQPAPIVSKCEASCAAKCPCCVKPAENNSAPLVPASSSRTSLQKDFQFVVAVVAHLAPLPEITDADISHNTAPVSSSPLPIFLRDRALLL
jgi:hypothetical protein